MVNVVLFPGNIVSIHAPTRGATPAIGYNRFQYPGFNPRTHTGCDIDLIKRIFRRVVSIHAPTRGATFPNLSHGCHLLCFNPRTHTGCDSTFRISFRPILGFNPRTHTGCDGINKRNGCVYECFNPRTHTGCDNIPQQITDFRVVSIHAPTRGATKSWLNIAPPE